MILTVAFHVYSRVIASIETGQEMYLGRQDFVLGPLTLFVEVLLSDHKFVSAVLVDFSGLSQVSGVENQSEA